MINGIYRSYDSYDEHDIAVKVKENKGSYSLRLLTGIEQSLGLFEEAFRNTNKILIQKNRGRHCIRVIDNNSFTAYPYRAGVPYAFDRVEFDDEGNLKMCDDFSHKPENIKGDDNATVKEEDKT